MNQCCGCSTPATVLLLLLNPVVKWNIKTIGSERERRLKALASRASTATSFVYPCALVSLRIRFRPTALFSSAYSSSLMTRDLYHKQRFIVNQTTKIGTAI